MAAGTSDSVLGGASAAHPTSRVTFEPEVEARLKAYQEELAEAKAMLAKKDEVIVEVKAENAKKDDVIAEVKAEIAEVKAEIAEIKAENAKKDEVIAEVKAENAKKDEVIADVRSKLLEALAQIKKEEHQQASESRGQSSTVRTLITGKAMNPAKVNPAFGVRPSIRRPTSTVVSPKWMPMLKKNVAAWEFDAFTSHLKTADNVKVSLDDGEEVGLLNLILDAVPDEYTASKISGEMYGAPRAEMFETSVERDLARGPWFVLERLIGAIEPLSKVVSTLIEPSFPHHVVAESEHYKGIFFPDDSILVQLKDGPRSEVKLGDVCVEDPPGTAERLRRFGFVIVEVKVDYKFPVAPYRLLEKNKVLNDMLFDPRYTLNQYVHQFEEAAKYNPAAQEATYQLLLRMRWGAITTVNRTCFTELQVTEKDWCLRTTPYFDVDAVNPLPGSSWSLLEIWIRYLVASIGKSRLDVIPDNVKEHFMNKARFKRSAKAGAPRKKSRDEDSDENLSDEQSGMEGDDEQVDRGGGSTSKGNDSGTQTGSGEGGQSQQTGTVDSVLSYADLWDARRFAFSSEGVPPEIEFSLKKLEGDAEIIAEGRVGRVFRKTIHGVDTVVKVLVLSCKRDELDGERNVYPTVILDELVREAEAYARLESLQGSVVPRFLCHSSSFLGNIHLFATEYAGEPLSDDGRILPIVAEQMRCALRSVHQLGVAHGDVALKNFVFKPVSGEPVLLDFGLCSFQNDMDAEEWDRVVLEEMDALETELDGVVIASAPHFHAPKIRLPMAKRRFQETGLPEGDFLCLRG